jgi:hypothetical protein
VPVTEIREKRMGAENRQIAGVAGNGAAEEFPADELAWRAFCYLHGELTADEAEAFEEDLAVEQPVREALAQAVKLSAALEAAGEMPAAAGYGIRSVPTTLGSRPAWWRRLARPRLVIGAAVAACLVVAVTLGVWGRFGRDDHSGTGSDNGNAQAALAKAWAEFGVNDDWRPPDHDPEPSPEDEHGRGDHEEDLNLPSVPSWLLAAVDLKNESREMKQ